MFGRASELAILLSNGNVAWELQTDTSGAPNGTNRGEDVSESPVVFMRARLRENLRFRRGRVDITDDDVTTGDTYEVAVRNTTASFSPASLSGTEAEHVQTAIRGLARAVNNDRQDVRARTIDTDDDNLDDRMLLESNYSAFTVSNVQNSTDYFVTANGTKITFTSDSSATEVEILDGLKSEINNSAEPIEAFTDDTTGNGDVDTLWVKPVESDSIVWGSISGNLTQESAGKETGNPYYAIPSSSADQLSLDADATGAKAILFTIPGPGESSGADTPTGWGEEQLYQDINYTGFKESEVIPDASRAYLQLIPDHGTIRSVHLGPTVID